MQAWPLPATPAAPKRSKRHHRPPRALTARTATTPITLANKGLGLDGRRLCNTHYIQEPQPDEYIRARAQLILAKAGALDPAIGHRHTAPDYESWLRAVSVLLPQWDGHHVLSEAVSWANL